MSYQSLAGRTFDVDLGPFVPRLSFLSDTSMRLVAQIGDVAVDEVVTVDIANPRPDLFVVAWKESGGNFIVQVQDHAAGTVHNHARLADGNLFQVTGTVKPVSN